MFCGCLVPVTLFHAVSLSLRAGDGARLGRESALDGGERDDPGGGRGGRAARLPRPHLHGAGPGKRARLPHHHRRGEGGPSFIRARRTRLIRESPTADFVRPAATGKGEGFSSGGYRLWVAWKPLACSSGVHVVVQQS